MSREVLINGIWPLILPASSASEWEANMMYHGNTWEIERLKALERLIKPGSIVLYVGAYKGDMPALLASWGAKLIIVEASAGFWPLIKETWELNKLPDPIGFWSGLIGRDSDTGGIANDILGWPLRMAPYEEGKVGFSHLAENGHDVLNYPRINIDTLCKILEVVPDIITIDVEGSELEAAYGGMTMITANKPAWVLSVHPEFMFHNHGTYERELHDLFRNNKFKGTWIDYDHEHHWLYERSNI